MNQGFTGLAAAPERVERIRRVCWAAASAAVVVNPDPVPLYPVDGMSVAFSLPAAALCHIIFDVRAVRVDYSDRFVVYDGQERVAFLYPNDALSEINGGYLIKVNENNGQQGHLFATCTLPAGAHNIQIYASAAGSTNSVTYYDRMLAVLILA